MLAPKNFEKLKNVSTHVCQKKLHLQMPENATELLYGLMRSIDTEHQNETIDGKNQIVFKQFIELVRKQQRDLHSTDEPSAFSGSSHTNAFGDARLVDSDVGAFASASFGSTNMKATSPMRDTSGDVSKLYEKLQQERSMNGLTRDKKVPAVLRSPRMQQQPRPQPQDIVSNASPTTQVVHKPALSYDVLLTDIRSAMSELRELRKKLYEERDSIKKQIEEKTNELEMQVSSHNASVRELQLFEQELLEREQILLERENMLKTKMDERSQLDVTLQERKRICEQHELQLQKTMASMSVYTPTIELHTSKTKPSSRAKTRTEWLTLSTRSRRSPFSEFSIDLGEKITQAIELELCCAYVFNSQKMDELEIRIDDDSTIIIQSGRYTIDSWLDQITESIKGTVRTGLLLSFPDTIVIDGDFFEHVSAHTYRCVRSIPCVKERNVLTIVAVLGDKEHQMGVLSVVPDRQRCFSRPISVKPTDLSELQMRIRGHDNNDCLDVQFVLRITRKIKGGK